MKPPPPQGLILLASLAFLPSRCARKRPSRQSQCRRRSSTTDRLLSLRSRRRRIRATLTDRRLIRRQGSWRIWRDESENPQVPQRYENQFQGALIAGTDPVGVELQLDPLSAGKTLSLRATEGITVYPAQDEFAILANGHCSFQTSLQVEYTEGDLAVIIDGLKTNLPVRRAWTDVMDVDNGTY